MPHHSIAHSVPSAAGIAALVTATYDLAPITECRLLQRGFNDSYVVRIETGERFILRLSISRHRLRAEADVAAETAFLTYLDAANVPVATAVPTKDGHLFTTSILPDGPRPTVLFHHAEGRAPDLDAPADARAQAITLAQLHLAADSYPGRQDGRHRLYLDQLLHRPAQAIQALDLGASRARDDLATLEMLLADAVGRLDADLTRTRCHGDVHSLNARIAEAGSHAGKAVFFDFDEGGFGYLAYDLAVHLWAQVSFGRRRHHMWHAFDAGYRSIRPLEPADEAAIPVFAAIRHIWLIGEWAAGTPRFGTEYMPTQWLENQLTFLLAWERDQLARRLL
jgi:Ser/Thr protein kinase RdoA (MazF antagonist)